MKLEKIKLKNIVDEQLKSEELELLKGGEYGGSCAIT
jgi:natural product precursor